MMIKKVLAVAMGLSMFAAPAFAQGRMDRREDRQDQRIENGRKTGQLSRAEAMRLQRAQANLEAEMRMLRARQGGRLTRMQRASFERRQNELSRRIYEQKHDRNRC